MTSIVHVPVLIVGAGPVGVTLANLLGTYGVDALAVERGQAVFDFPRAVGLDDEALRTMQSAGVADDMMRDMIQNVPMRMYTADKRCFAEILPGTREYGWFRRNLFSQPLAEHTLRRALQRFPHVGLQLGVELHALEQDADGVTATLRNADGELSTVRAQYLVAADGGRSTVREMLKVPYEGRTHAHKWVVIECDQDPLDAPYTALHCEPQRPYVCLRLPYGLRRWEFMLFPGEDGEQMLSPDKVQMLLRAHVPNPEKLNVIRARVYTHNSRIAKTFVVGRVCLAGDAAHITPPWIGQGLNAGIRDAFNLAWKLAWIVQGRMSPKLLESYHDERYAHAKAMIELADLFGSVLSQRNRLVAWLRDRFFLAIRDIPRVRDYVLQMKFKPMPRFSQGVVLNSGDDKRDSLIGRMFIQPMVERDGAVMRLDDAIGPRFALLGWRGHPLGNVPATLCDRLQSLGCVPLVGVRARSSSAEMNCGAHERIDTLTVQDHENQLQLWFQQRGVDWVLLRPDRHIAAVGTWDDATAQLQSFCELMGPVAPPRSEAGRLAAREGVAALT